MHHAAIRANTGVAHDGVLDRQVAHLLRHGLPVIGLGRRHRLQVMQHARIHARLHHGGLIAFVQFFKACGEGAGFVVHIPVKALGEQQALRLVQTQRVHVRQEHQQRCNPLVLAVHAKLPCRLDGIDRVLRAVGQANDLGLGVLRLQHEGRKIARIERVAHAAQYRTALGLDHVRGVFFQRVAKSVVDGEEVPRFEARLRERRCRTRSRRIGIKHPVETVGCAILIGQPRGGGAAVERNAAFFLDQLLDCQGACRIGQVGQGINLVAVHPLARPGSGDVGLVLVVGTHHLDLHVLAFSLEAVLDRHARCHYRACTAHARIGSCHVGQNTNLDHAIRDLRLCTGAKGQHPHRNRISDECLHICLLVLYGLNLQSVDYGFTLSLCLCIRI